MTSRRTVPVALLWALVAGLLVAGGPAPAVAATITVDTFAQVDAAKCTLTNAINSANDDVNVAGCVRVGGIGPDTIVLPTGIYALTVPDNGTGIDLTGLPVVTTDITILGNGSIATRTNGTGGPFFRIFAVTAGTLSLVELTASGGRVAGVDGESAIGGGIKVVGAGSLALNTVTISNNHVVGRGGGIGADGTGTLTVTDSTVINNSVTGDRLFSHSAQGGGIYTAGLAVTITRSRISNNVANADHAPVFPGTAVGGGLAVGNASLTMTFVTVSGNTASAGGGALKGTALGGGLDYSGSSGDGLSQLTVSDSTFSANAALVNGGGSVALGEGGGGAISFRASTNVTIQRSAFIQNTSQANGDENAGLARGGVSRGGAIRHVSDSNLNLFDTTLANNTATARPGPDGSGGHAQGGAVSFEGPGQLTLRNVSMTGNAVDSPGGTPLGGGIASRSITSLQNSIVIGNSLPSNCSATDPVALFVSFGNNINPASGSCGGPVASDKPNADPELGALVDLGRAAGQYLPLLPTSPAIDGGNPLSCSASDQLGQSRVGACDIGAVELVPATVGYAAVLPSARAGQLGAKLTAFVSVINASPATAFKVGIELVTSVPVLFAYQTANALNVPVGSPNTPVDIAPGGTQTYIISVTPTAALPPTELVLAFTGTKTSVASTVGVNTMLVSASVTPIPDLVALVATLGNNGIVDIPTSSGIGVFTLATVNLGSGDLITVTADTGAAVVPLSVLMCQTNLAGACLQPATASVTAQINAGATPTFGLFPVSTGPIILDPGGTRIFVRLRDSTGAVRGGSSVAPRTVP